METVYDRLRAILKEKTLVRTHSENMKMSGVLRLSKDVPLFIRVHSDPGALRMDDTAPLFVVPVPK